LSVFTTKIGTVKANEELPLYFSGPSTGAALKDRCFDKCLGCRVHGATHPEALLPGASQQHYSECPFDFDRRIFHWLTSR